MTSIIQSTLKPVSKAVQSHITKRTASNLYDAKFLLGTSIALDVYSNSMDYVKISRNKKIKKEEKNYLKSYKACQTFVSTAGQLAVGTTLLNKKLQEKMFNGFKKTVGLSSKTLNSNASNTFRVLSTLAGSIVITKRILVPLIVTPLASFFKNKLNDREKNIYEKDND